MDATSQEWQQLPSLLASLLSYPHVRADPVGAQCISAVCDLMACAQTAVAVAATADDSAAESLSAKRSKGKRSASTLNNTIATAEKYARRCRKWGIETCLHTLTAQTLQSTNCNNNSSSSTFATLPALDAVLCKAGVSSSNEDNELLLQLQQTLECGTTTASNSCAPYAETVVQLKDELLRGFTNVQHSASDTNVTGASNIQYRPSETTMCHGMAKARCYQAAYSMYHGRPYNSVNQQLCSAGKHTDAGAISYSTGTALLSLTFQDSLQVQRTWQAIDSTLNALLNNETFKTAAHTTATATDNTAVHSDSSSDNAKALQCCTNKPEQHVMWCLRVWTCVTSSRMVATGVIAAVACFAALSSSTPTCQQCKTGNTSGSCSSSSSSNAAAVSLLAWLACPDCVQARQDMTVALTIVFTTLLHHKTTTITSSEGKQKRTTVDIAAIIQKLQHDSDTSTCMSLYGVYIGIAHCVVQYSGQESEVDTVIQLLSQAEDRSDCKPDQQCVQQALHDSSAALNAYSAHNSNDTRHQQTASSDSSSSSSNDYLSHMPGFASTVAAVKSWLLSNA
eukprot:2386-Heterococcus_DN1.PRE.9